MQQTLEQVRFDEVSRLRELVSQQRAHREQSVTNNGHGLAMSAAASGMSPTAQLSHQLSGLAGIKSIKALDDKLQSEEALADFAQSLADIHQAILKAPRQLLVVAEEHLLAECKQSITELHNNTSLDKNIAFSLPEVRQTEKQVWITNTQVNFCAKAYPTVPVSHPDAAALTVLGGFLRNGYLHRAIREQGGAYGGGASQDSNIAAFRFYSYRDPRLEETLADFDGSIHWLLDTDHDDEQLEQAILGVISSLDKPASPAGEAKHSFHSDLFGRDVEQRRTFRRSILAVTIADLKRVAKRYLLNDQASFALVTNQANYQQAENFIKEQRFELFNL